MTVEAYDEATGTVIVKRAVKGSVLSAHAVGARIQKFNQFRVVRSVCGSTAASHEGGAKVYSWNVPPLIKQLAVGEAIGLVQQTISGFARVVGTGDNQTEAKGIGLEGLWQKAIDRYRVVRFRKF
jgi:hypothetical protein